MNQQEKRIKIAEACGWTRTRKRESNGQEYPNGWENLKERRSNMPDYFNDLNACHEMEKHIEKEVFYMMNLVKVMKESGTLGTRIDRTYRASAAQRAEAFGLTLGLWKEGE